MICHSFCLLVPHILYYSNYYQHKRYNNDSNTLISGNNLLGTKDSQKDNSQCTPHSDDKVFPCWVLNGRKEVAAHVCPYFLAQIVVLNSKNGNNQIP